MGSLTGGSDLWKKRAGRDRSGVALVGEGERERVRPRETMVERREG